MERQREHGLGIVKYRKTRAICSSEEACTASVDKPMRLTLVIWPDEQFKRLPFEEQDVKARGCYLGYAVSVE